MPETFLDAVARDDALRKIVETGVTSVGAQEGSLLLLEPTGLNLRFTVCCSPVADKLQGLQQSVGDGISGLSFQMQQPMIVNDTQTDPAYDPHVDKQVGVVTTTIMVVPIATPDEEFGVLTAINKPGGFSQNDMNAYLDLTETIAIALTAMEAKHAS